MAVTFDSAFQASRGSGAKPFAFTSDAGDVAGTVNNNPNRVLIGFAGFRAGGVSADYGTVSMSWNGVAMTAIGQAVNAGDTMMVACFGLIAPATGNNTLSVSWTGSASGEVSAGAISLYNADQVTGWTSYTTNTATDTAASLTIATAAGDMLVAGLSTNQSDGTVTSGTRDWAGVEVGWYMGFHNAASGTSTNAAITLGASVAWVMNGVRVLRPDIAIPSGGTGIGAAATNGSSVTITLPTLAENDVVYVWGGFTNTGVTPGISSPSDFATLVDQVSGSYRYYLGRKVMGASPDTSLTCINTGDALDAASYNAICLRNVDPTTPEDNTVTVTPSSGNNPDVGAVTVVTDRAAVLVLVAGTSIDVAGITLTNYTVVPGALGNDNRDSTANGAYRFLLSPGSEDPGAYAGWSITDWVGATVAVRPSSEGGGGGAAAKNTRAWPLGIALGMHRRMPV